MAATSLFHGAMATSSSWRCLPPTMKSSANGGARICLSCRSSGKQPSCGTSASSLRFFAGLMQRADVDEVVNACDAGREGELIFRLVYEKAGCTKPMKRLWLSSMEPAEIRRAFENMRPGAEYDNLYAAALCRAKADWLVGMNATRLMSLVYHRTLNVGRVVSPDAVLASRAKERDRGISAGNFLHRRCKLRRVFRYLVNESWRSLKLTHLRTLATARCV